MPMPNQIRCLPGKTRVSTPRDFPRESISLGLPLEAALGMPLELRKSTPRVATLSASARQLSQHAKAIALLQSNKAVGLRALAHVSASFDCNSPMLWPPTHSGRSWVPRWLEQKAGGGQRRKLSCGRSANAFPKMPAARTAPDRRPTPSLCSVVPQAGGQARFALKRSTRSVALGSAPSPVARWDSLLLLSRPASVSAGALPSPCAAWGRLIALSGPVGALRKLRQTREVLAACAPVCWRNLHSATRRGLRALARIPAVGFFLSWYGPSMSAVQTLLNQQAVSKQSSSKE
jgi:hypothetical protein